MRLCSMTSSSFRPTITMCSRYTESVVWAPSRAASHKPKMRRNASGGVDPTIMMCSRSKESVMLATSRAVSCRAATAGASASTSLSANSEACS